MTEEDGRTDGKWKIEQCSVGPETAIEYTACKEKDKRNKSLFILSVFLVCSFKRLDVRNHTVLH